MKNYYKTKQFILIAFVSLITMSTYGQKNSNKPEYQVVLKSEVEWSYLNPARKDKAPMAGTLWGNRKGKEATGFLLKPSDGFQSPPHTHNVSYRAVVISGLIHNDDPNATSMWLPAGSFWTQPKGEVHITAAKGSNTLAYVEIEEGPYLVLPPEDHFDSGERPINVDKTNMVWLDAGDVTWIEQPGKIKTKAKIAFLWGKVEEGELNGTFIKLPSGFSGKIKSNGESFRSVIIQGTPHHRIPGEDQITTLEPGSFFSSQGKAEHIIRAEKETILYVRSEGEYVLLSE